MSMRDRVRVLEREMLGKAQTEHFHGEYPHIVTCESCGCAVVKGQEVAGAVEIRRRSPQKAPENLTQVGIWQWHMVGYFPGHPTEPYLHTPVYCKRCAGEKAKPKRSHHKK